MLVTPENDSWIGLFVPVHDSGLIPFVGIFACSTLSTMLAMPMAMMAGMRMGLVDQPDVRRKPGQLPIPRVGGLAMVAGAAMAGLLALPWMPGILAPHHAWIGLGLMLVVALGVLDDRFGMRGRHKLLGQIVSSMLIVLPGQQSIDAITIAGIHWELGGWGAFLAVFLLVGAMNSANLLDGMDGFLGSVGLASGATLLVIGLIGDLPGVVVASSLFVGCMLGFLSFNRPPARVYLGDCGSMLVGASIAMLAMACGHTGFHSSGLPLAVPAGVLFLPIIDTLAAVVRRRLTGRSIYSADRSHLHHCLALAGFKPARAAGLAFLVGASVGFMVVVAQLTGSDMPAWAAMTLAGGTLVGTGLFGRAEARLVARRLRELALPPRARISQPDADRALHLQGKGRWDEAWLQFVGLARKMGIGAITLDIDMPWASESFHGRWDDGVEFEPGSDWKLDLPVSATGRIFGRVSLRSFKLDLPVDKVVSEFQPALESLRQKVLALDLSTTAVNHAFSGHSAGGVEP